MKNLQNIKKTDFYILKHWDSNDKRFPSMGRVENKPNWLRLKEINITQAHSA